MQKYLAVAGVGAALMMTAGVLAIVQFTTPGALERTAVADAVETQATGGADAAAAARDVASAEPAVDAEVPEFNMVEIAPGDVTEVQSPQEPGSPSPKSMLGTLLSRGGEAADPSVVNSTNQTGGSFARRAGSFTSNCKSGGGAKFCSASGDK